MTDSKRQNIAVAPIVPSAMSDTQTTVNPVSRHMLRSASRRSWMRLVTQPAYQASRAVRASPARDMEPSPSGAPDRFGFVGDAAL